MRCDPLICGILGEDDPCPACRARRPAPVALPSVAEVRHRQRGRRLARLVREHAGELREAVLELIAADVAEAIAAGGSR